MDRKTPLYENHVSLNGKIVPFAGYLLPIQYKTGIIDEHMAVRNKAGLFDVSHMGEVMYEGEDALANLNFALTNDFSNMVDGQVRYSLMCNDKGGIVDDLLVYRFNQQKYMVVVNAANRHKDVARMKSLLFGNVKFADVSDDVAQIAIQGPNSDSIMKLIADKLPEKYYYFTEDARIDSETVIISKTGYTGENGYEIYLSNESAPRIWNKLLGTGKDYGLIPCGLGARDTLRLEASMPLYGHELNEEITPFEAGLDFAVKMIKENFAGKSELEKAINPSRKRVGLKIVGRGVVRENLPIYIGNKQIGFSTSGTFSPYFNYPIAMALIDKSYANFDTEIEVDVRGRRVLAKVVPMPFYKKQ